MLSKQTSLLEEDVEEILCLSGCGADVENVGDLCDNCFECVRCMAAKNFDQMHEGPNSELYCVRCFERDFATCDECSAVVDREYTYTDRDGGTYCGDCCSICDDCGYACDSVNSDGYCRACRSGNLMDYLERAPDILGFLGEPKDNLYFGVELEVECVDVYDMETQVSVVNEQLQGFVICKEDCSVDDGFEIVTAPATMEIHYEKWKPFFKNGRNKNFRNRGATNGMHVHFSRAGVTPSQLARMIVFLHEPANKKFVEMIAGRSLSRGNGASYSALEESAIGRPVTAFAGVAEKNMYVPTCGRRYNTKTVKQEKEIYNKAAIGSRGAYNDLNRKTIEIRMFRGVNRERLLFKNLEFVHALIKFCMPGVCSFGELRTPDAFIKYAASMGKTYKHLNSYIVNRWIKTGGNPTIFIQTDQNRADN